MDQEPRMAFVVAGGLVSAFVAWKTVFCEERKANGESYQELWRIRDHKSGQVLRTIALPERLLTAVVIFCSTGAVVWAKILR